MISEGRYQEVVKKIQQFNKDKMYQRTIKICQYWINKINPKTGVIHYFLAQAYNGVKEFNLAIDHHKKALKHDNKLADIKDGEYEYKNHYHEEKTNCLVCNANNYEIVNVNNQSKVESNKGIINPLRVWVRCKNCGTIYPNPIPKESALNKYYSLFAKNVNESVNNRFEFLIRLSNERLQRIENLFSNQSTNNLKLIDIGTGPGVFVATAIDRGWDAKGLELAEKNCVYAKESFNIDLINKDIKNFDPDEKFDVITLFEVIEHLRNPNQILQKLNSLLKSNGILVLATPIKDSVYGKKMKEKSIFWTTVAHLFYFEKRVIESILKDNGLEVFKINQSLEGMGRLEFYCQKNN